MIKVYLTLRPICSNQTCVPWSRSVVIYVTTLLAFYIPYVYIIISKFFSGFYSIVYVLKFNYINISLLNKGYKSGVLL